MIRTVLSQELMIIVPHDERLLAMHCSQFSQHLARVLRALGCGRKKGASNMTYRAKAAIVFGVVICLPLAAACSSSSREQANSGVPAGGNSGEILANVRPGQSAKSYLPASVVTWPGASCSLHPEGSANPAESIPVFADDDGVARFYAVRASAEDATRRLSLDCHDDDGRTGTYPVDLESDFTFQPRQPLVAPSSASLRPALVGDPLLYSQSELLEAGYGLRPDPGKNPEGYAHWLKSTTRPLRLVKSKARELPVSFAPSSLPGPIPCIICFPTTTTTWAQDWGGPALTGYVFSTPTFVLATAEIQVPTAIPGGDGTTYASGGMWTGVGGLGSPLIQSGVGIFTSPTAANYAAFVQYPPGQSRGRFLFNVHPTDIILAEAWSCDGYGTLTANGEYGCFWLWNETTGQFQACESLASDCPPVHGTGGFNGGTADFIFEKPAGWPYLPDYFCCATITGSAEDSQGNWHNFSTDNIDLFRLYGYGTGSFQELEFVHILSSNQVLFQFNERSGGH
jgi:hypothetical protein